ncbi:FAD-binding domain-containing protein [Amanita rubescens]|nr:FAD-binding domain-containing protein [Amanita rubescens]KAF8332208.1 FAD-binding domain-containing protein [Amanita rubescens]KAF8348407.1 FAD-binding domain-containing protein [Amanita rubescens]
MLASLYYFVSVLPPLVLCNPFNIIERDSTGYKKVCQAISTAISPQSAVFYPGSKIYDNDTFHWGITSSQQSACSVEPGTPQDVGKILQILGQSRTPFAVKSGGHIMNPGFSSTPGVQIALTRFNEVVYDSSTETVEFGSGLLFDNVYDALAPYNRSVAGARVAGIGVGGFLLGGGYAWKTNQVGLGIDTIVAYELVKPNGKVVKVTKQSDAELFFGLKGGLNNFGVVTRFTLNALPQSAVWAGTIIYPPSSVPDVTAAVIKFSANNNDTKANISPAYSFSNGSVLVSHTMYYDGPSPPPGLFDDFLKIPAVSNDVHTRSFTDFINSGGLNSLAGLRGVFHTVPLLKHSPKVMAAIQNETSFWGQSLFEKIGFVGYTVEPFIPSILSHNTTPTAYPPTRNHVYFPLNIFFGWLNATYDNDFYDAIRQSATQIHEVAIRDRQDIIDAPLYPNYAIFDTPLRDMYSANVDKLLSLKQRIDPRNVMGLTGGFRF